MPANRPLQVPNATPVRTQVTYAATPRACRPRLLAAVVRSNATLAFAAERQVVRQQARSFVGGCGWASGWSDWISTGQEVAMGVPSPRGGPPTCRHSSLSLMRAMLPARGLIACSKAEARGRRARGRRLDPDNRCISDQCPIKIGVLRSSARAVRDPVGREAVGLWEWTGRAALPVEPAVAAADDGKGCTAAVWIGIPRPPVLCEHRIPPSQLNGKSLAGHNLDRQPYATRWFRR